MKKLVLLLAFVAGFQMMYAQSPIGKGGKNINFGTGFSTYGLPVYLGMDWGVHKDITVGFNASYRFNGDGSDPLGIYANGNYHFNTIWIFLSSGTFMPVSTSVLWPGSVIATTVRLAST